MSEQLKPCPICGDRILLGVCASEHGEWSWECDNGDCFMQGVVEAASREEAVVKLNRRVQPVVSAQQNEPNDELLVDALMDGCVDDDVDEVELSRRRKALLSRLSGGQQTRAMEMMQDDIAELLRVLGLGDHARPVSPAVVMRNEIIPAVRALKGGRHRGRRNETNK